MPKGMSGFTVPRMEQDQLALQERRNKNRKTLKVFGWSIGGLVLLSVIGSFLPDDPSAASKTAAGQVSASAKPNPAHTLDGLACAPTMRRVYEVQQAFRGAGTTVTADDLAATLSKVADNFEGQQSLQTDPVTAQWFADVVTLMKSIRYQLVAGDIDTAIQYEKQLLPLMMKVKEYCPNGG